jgi:hypothetical protein
MIMIQPHQRSAVKGQVFGARKDSCSCNPCDCNPCTCGDSLIPNYPSWRISGYFVQGGRSHEQQLSEQILISLAQPEREGSQEGWQEVLLVGSETSFEQIHALLTLFESDLESMPAEIKAPPKVKRTVYRASMEYQMTEKGPHLRVAFSPELANLVREGSGQQEARAWTYDGPARLRGNFHRASL